MPKVYLQANDRSRLLRVHTDELLPTSRIRGVCLHDTAVRHVHGIATFEVSMSYDHLRSLVASQRHNRLICLGETSRGDLLMECAADCVSVGPCPDEVARSVAEVFSNALHDVRDVLPENVTKGRSFFYVQFATKPAFTVELAKDLLVTFFGVVELIGARDDTRHALLAAHVWMCRCVAAALFLVGDVLTSEIDADAYSDDHRTLLQTLDEGDGPEWAKECIRRLQEFHSLCPDYGECYASSMCSLETQEQAMLRRACDESALTIRHFERKRDVCPYVFPAVWTRTSANSVYLVHA